MRHKSKIVKIYSLPCGEETFVNPVTMTPKQYSEAIDRLGLSQTAAGTFLGVDPRQPPMGRRRFSDPRKRC